MAREFLIFRNCCQAKIRKIAIGYFLFFRNNSAMAKSDLDWILEGLRKPGKTKKGLADALGRYPSVVTAILKGERELKARELATIAEYLEVEPPRTPSEEQHVLPVIGAIGAGGTIDVASEQLSQADPLFEITVPFPVPPDAVGLQVKGSSMWPRYDEGDVIICYRYSQDPEPLVGWEAAVGTPDGERYLKNLMRGSARGLYNLESHNAPPMRDVIISWASEIFGVVRAARWRKLDEKGKRREIQKAMNQ